MERGLLWLPLLAVFIWLAWAGWNEYQKVEAYNRWAQSFQTAKYDIYAVLGHSGDTITWGIPTRREPVNLETIALKDIQTITLVVDRQPVESATLPTRGRSVMLELTLTGDKLAGDKKVVQIPFTDIVLADQWRHYLQKNLPT